MSIHQVELWFFLPALLALYWLGVGRRVWQNAALVLGGFAFYWAWNPSLVWVLALAIGVDYGLGRFMGAEGRPEGQRKAALALSLVYNLGQLGYFKYVGFFATSFNELMSAAGLNASAPVLKIALPLGISYFTFSKMAYVIEVYYRRTPVCTSLLDFAAWVSFFPQLAAGPIVRPSQLLPQLAEGRRPSAAVIGAGARAFLLGFALKAYVADWLGPNIVDPIMSAEADYSAAMHWLGVVGYALQIFGDFAGYSLMAIGLGRLFGLELPENFNFPFLSQSLMDFWRRWHITLNTWLFDYLYGPLTLSRGWWRGRLDLGFLVVFAISGLWHGAAWGFVVWGVMHGVALVVERRWGEFYKGLCRKDRAWVKRRQTRAYALLAWGLTQLWFVLTLIPFRIHDLGDMSDFARGLFVSSGTTTPPGLESLRELQNFAVILAFLVAWHLSTTRLGQAAWRRFEAAPAPLRGVAYGLALVYLFIFVPLSAGTFVYANF